MAIMEIRADAVHPKMWRVCLPNGRLSDMVNLTRAKEAAETIARQNDPEIGWTGFRWHPWAS